MSNDVDLLYLLAKGQLSPAAVDEKELSPLSLPVYKTIAYLVSRGVETPLNLDQVKKLAKVKFNANDKTLELIDEVTAYAPDAQILEAVRDRTVIKKLLEDASFQLTGGQYDLSRLEKLLSVGGAVSSYIQRPTLTPKSAAEVYTIKTGIPGVDSILTGLGSELVIVSARPKQGKSTFLLNVICNQPIDTKVLYITVADYGYDEICSLIHHINPATLSNHNLFIVDFTGIAATVNDVEGAIKEVQPNLCIVDRAEKLSPMGGKSKRREVRHEVAEVFDAMRIFAKKYHTPILVDAQYSGAGEERARKHLGMSSEFMAEDRTGRQAVMDLWIGLRRRPDDEREGWRVQLWMEGRRQGSTLPAMVEIRTNSVGRYLTNTTSHK